MSRETQALANTQLLLIEPVWNRNTLIGAAPTTLHCLLIEPVWNRNRANRILVFTWAPTFNRTSMESKLYHVPPIDGRSVPFNRTSMESKLSFLTVSNASLNLLIEPVWNRNFLWILYPAAFGDLLIEPVWNRNIPTSITKLGEAAFNRTSMESKQRTSGQRNNLSNF